MEIIRERSPQFEAELKRDFRPTEVREGDFSYRVVGSDLRMRFVHRRQRKVRFVSLDQNSETEIVEDLGPATNADSWVMPCDGEVEWAQAVELFEWAARKRAEMETRRAWVKPLRDAAFNASVRNHFDEAAKRARGLSTFGPHQRIQRST